MWKILIITILLFALVVSGTFYYEYKHPCIKSHTEQQREMPISVVVWATKWFGGVAVPMWNAKLIDSIVCDERK